MQGSEMRTLRKASGMTQAEFGQAIGMTATSVGLMERGAAPITERTMRSVAALDGLAIVGPDVMGSEWGVVRRFSTPGANHMRLVERFATEAAAEEYIETTREAAGL